MIGDKGYSFKKRVDIIVIHASFTILGSLISFYIVDRFNRKTLMFFGLVTLGIIQSILGAVVMLSGEFNVIIALISLIIVIYEATIAPLYWVYAPELMKLDDFSRNQVFYWTFVWLNLIICYEAPEAQAPVIIMTFAFLCLCLACVVWCFVIETRNKNWEEKYTMMTDVQ